MACSNNTVNQTTCSSCNYNPCECGGQGRNHFLIIVVLYILLAIILGSVCNYY